MVSYVVYIDSRVVSISHNVSVNILIGKWINDSSGLPSGKLVMISIVQTGGIISVVALSFLISGFLFNVKAVMNCGVIK